VRRLDGFDGLRALAAMLVIAYHAGSLAGASSAGPLWMMVAALKAGVAVFFVISGFLLYLPYARAIRAGRPLPDWREFARRRAIRILPGYWVALAVLAAIGLADGVLTPDWWRFFGLAQIYDPSTLFKGLGVAWSLCTELTFYAMLPALSWALARLARGRSAGEATRVQLDLVAALALGSLALRLFMAGSALAPVPDAHVVLATSLPGLFDWFAVGIAFAVLRTAWETGSTLPAALQALARRPGRCWLGATVLYLLAAAAQRGEFFLPSYGLAAHFAIGLAAGLLVLPAVLPAPLQRSRTRSFLCSRALTWLGTISYGMYLWHVPFLHLIDQWAGVPRGVPAFAGLLAATLAGAICLGAASWYLVERPAQRWLRSRRTVIDDRRLPVEALEGHA